MLGILQTRLRWIHPAPSWDDFKLGARPGRSRRAIARGIAERRANECAGPTRKDSFSSLLAYSADMNGIRRFYALPDRNAECSHRIFGRVLLCEQIPSAVPAPNSLPESGDARLSRQEG